jgi:GGDEF domain-containing protein
VSDHSDQAPVEGTVAERLARAARAAQQLCDTLWESLHDELRDPSAERIRELSERLAGVSSTVALLAVGDFDAITPAVASAEETAAPVVERRIPSTPPEPPRVDPRPTPDLRLAPHPPAAPEPPGQEERRATSEPSATGLSPQPDTPIALQPIPTRAGDYTFTKLVDEHAPRTTAEPAEAQAPEIEIRDVRREEGPSAWVSSVGRLLTRHGQDGLPFAVLLVEIVDVARLERSETPHDLHGLVAQVESALGRGMRSTDELSRETLGRYWLVAPETNGTGARMLAERLARLVRTSAIHRGVPLEVAIGIAVCPDDGTEAPALAARADLGVYSARATGRSIAHTDPPSQR